MAAEKLAPGVQRLSAITLSEISYAKEKIILFTTHRYDTIRQADTIVVLLDGRLAEMGTHEELERNAREFWSLYLAQGSLALVGPTSEQKEAR